MRIQQLTLENVRLFQGTHTLSFAEDKPITVLLADNGGGKSTILDCISTMLSSFISRFPQQKEQNFSPFDVHINEHNRSASHLSAQLVLNTDEGEVSFTRKRKGQDRRPKSTSNTQLAQLRAFAQRFLTDEQELYPLPILAYYGTERGHITPPERKRNFQKIFQRSDCYTDALVASTNFKRFFMWFDQAEDEERREITRRRDFNYRSPLLQAVRQAIARLDTGYDNPHIETSPLRFLLDHHNPQGNHRSLRIDRLSDGYKIGITLVADIAGRMAEANPQLGENMLQSPGIVLIDEIDLHLHPIWQKRILRQLHDIFPNLQFIVSTHSPLVLLGALDLIQVVRLQDGNIHVSHTDFAQEYQHYDTSLLLLSDLFGVSSVRSPQYDELTRERNELIDNPQRTPEQAQRLQELDAQMAQFGNVEIIEFIKLLKQFKL